MSQFHILSLSGGGYKGLFTAKVLEELEADIGYPIANKFDLIAGTSIGGIIAIALALEIPSAKIVELFLKDGKKIFPPKLTFLGNSLGGLVRPKYDNNGLKEVLRSLFEIKTINDLKHRIIIPTVNYTTGKPQVVKTRHHEKYRIDYKKKLTDVAMATTAAPFFFPIYRTSGADYVDGGLVANHPGLFACIEAQKFLGIDSADIYQLHIGTLSQKLTSSGTYKAKNAGLFQWNKKLIELIFSCQEQSSSEIIKFILQEQYTSIDELLTNEQAESVGMDKVTSTSQTVLIQRAHSAVQSFFGTDFYSIIKGHNAPLFTPLPL